MRTFLLVLKKKKKTKKTCYFGLKNTQEQKTRKQKLEISSIQKKKKSKFLFTKYKNFLNKV